MLPEGTSVTGLGHVRLESVRRVLKAFYHLLIRCSRDSQVTCSAHAAFAIVDADFVQGNDRHEKRTRGQDLLFSRFTRYLDAIYHCVHADLCSQLRAHPVHGADWTPLWFSSDIALTLLSMEATAPAL